jgi:TorA maturation chaperone TorD
MEMREGGREDAIRFAGGIDVPVSALGNSHSMVPQAGKEFAGDGRAFEAGHDHTRSVPEPDLQTIALTSASEIDEVDLLRSHEYGLLALLFGRAPTQEVLQQVAALKGDATPLGLAHIHLAQLAATLDADAISREYFDLFIGIGRGEILPYASYYMTGFLHERPLARIRQDLARLGIERTDGQREPEDHIAILCEVMAGLASGHLGHDFAAERAFFDRHLKPWALRLFADCETAQQAAFYKAAGAVGRMFMELEVEAFAMET